MIGLLQAGLGGFLGAALRHGAGRLGRRLDQQAGWPATTLAINVVGCFLLAWLTAHVVARGAPTEGWRVFLGVGVLGGFTTWSTFGVDALRLAQEGSRGSLACYVGGHLALSAIAVVLGWRLGAA